MEIIIFNSMKGRYEAIDIEFSDENTKWFDDCENDDDIYMVTEINGCLLIRKFGYGYPVLIDGELMTDRGKKHCSRTLKHHYDLALEVKDRENDTEKSTRQGPVNRTGIGY